MDIRAYFEQAIFPIVKGEHSDLLPDLSILVLGSVGLGIDDSLSDLEVDLYLDDAVWKQQGASLQLTLNACLREHCPYQTKGSVISVSARSWLLDGHSEVFLKGAGELPWEDVPFHDLFTIQENLILWDPPRWLGCLREKTAPERLPDSLWKKLLLLQLKKLIWEDLGELESTAKRARMPEADILLGQVLEDLLHVGFIVNRQYYPWRTHLRWAFEKLSAPAPAILPLIDLASASTDWQEKVAAVQEAVSVYKGFIARNDVLPEINIRQRDLSNELEWAERLEAWSNPNWRDWMTQCEERTIQRGHPASDFWVASLWE